MEQDTRRAIDDENITLLDKLMTKHDVDPCELLPYAVQNDKLSVVVFLYNRESTDEDNDEELTFCLRLGAIIDTACRERNYRVMEFALNQGEYLGYRIEDWQFHEILQTRDEAIVRLLLESSCLNEYSYSWRKWEREEGNCVKAILDASAAISPTVRELVLDI